LQNGSILNPSQPDAASLQKLVCQRKPDCFSYADWRRLDQIELERGKAIGRPRLKFTSVEEMKKALGK
jgi:ferredoxin--NADP+ reductase